MVRLEEAYGRELSFATYLTIVSDRGYRDQGQDRADRIGRANTYSGYGRCRTDGSEGQVVDAVNDDLRILSTHISQIVSCHLGLRPS
jgi:hypothetical protein